MSKLLNISSNYRQYGVGQLGRDSPFNTVFNLKIMQTEIWKDIPGYEGKYQISNLGNVKSLNYLGHGNIKILKPYLNKYYYVTKRLK